MPGLLTIEQAAAPLAVNPWIIDAAIRNGRLAGTVFNGTTYITPRALRVWLGNDSFSPR